MGLNVRLLQIVLVSAQSLGMSSRSSTHSVQTHSCNTSLPDSTSPSRPSSDLNTTIREASSNTIGVPNETSINSIYATLPTTLTNSGPATTQAVNSCTTKDSSTVPVAPTTTDFFPRQTTTTSGLCAPSSLQSSSDKRTSPLRTSISIYTTSTSSVSLQDSASQSRTSSDLNTAKSKASSHITGVPNQTLSINSSHVTSPMTLTNSGPATTQALYFTSDNSTRQSSHVPVAPTTTDSSTKQTTTTSGLSTPSSLQSSSDKRTSPLTTSISIYPTTRKTSNAGSVTTETPPDNTLPSYPTSSVSLQDSASQSRTLSDLSITKSEASSHITGVPNQTISINSSHVTSPMTLTNSGPATTQALYFTSDHPTRQSSNVPVAPTTTDSSTKQTTTTSVSESFKLTEWSVDSSDCQRNCSNVGGTVTASRQCYLHTVTFDNSHCTKHQLKKVFKCGQLHCPISGTELLRMSIYTALAGSFLHMLPNFFGG